MPNLVMIHQLFYDFSATTTCKAFSCRFFCVSPVQSKRRNYEQQGLGLGLAIVQKIMERHQMERRQMERHQGELLIHSVINDKTTVTVKLPVSVAV